MLNVAVLNVNGVEQVNSKAVLKSKLLTRLYVRHDFDVLI